jgi:hypothetical protein
VINFIRENINWIKDIGTLAFAATGTIIAILTYRRARATVLQPIRNEVIKRQSELLSDLLHELFEIGDSFDNGLDYIDLVKVNVILALRDYGFVFSNQKELIDKTTEKTDGWIYCGESHVVNEVELIDSFVENDKEVKASSLNSEDKEKYENAKKGIVNINKIYITKKHNLFLNKLRRFSSNPFMPQRIQSAFEQLFSQVKNNLTVVLKNEIEEFIREFFRQQVQNNTIPKFNPLGVYNRFNHSRIHHQKLLANLKNEMRQYLLIDEPW